MYTHNTLFGTSKLLHSKLHTGHSQSLRYTTVYKYHLLNTYTDQNNWLTSCVFYRPRPISGPYGLDLALLETIEAVPVQCSAPKLAEFDLNYLNEPSAQ